MALKTNFISLKPENVEEAVWSAVVEGWYNGLSDRQAAFRASMTTGIEITGADIQKWQKDNPEIKELKYNLQDALLTAGKINIADSIRDGNTVDSKWLLERKAADEFSTKQAVAFEGAAIELSLADKEKSLADFVESFKDGE